MVEFSDTSEELAPFVEGSIVDVVDVVGIVVDVVVDVFGVVVDAVVDVVYLGFGLLRLLAILLRLLLLLKLLLNEDELKCPDPPKLPNEIPVPPSPPDETPRILPDETPVPPSPPPKLPCGR